jgi:hypothetical protein
MLCSIPISFYFCVSWRVLEPRQLAGRSACPTPFAISRHRRSLIRPPNILDHLFGQCRSIHEPPSSLHRAFAAAG